MQDGAPPDPAAANGVDDDDDDDGDLFAEDDDADAGVVDVAMDGAVEAPVHDDRRDARQAEGFRKANTGLSDMYDDSQGYYNFRVGELMGGRCGSESLFMHTRRGMTMRDWLAEHHVSGDVVQSRGLSKCE